MMKDINLKPTTSKQSRIFLFPWLGNMVAVLSVHYSERPKEVQLKFLTA